MKEINLEKCRLVSMMELSITELDFILCSNEKLQRDVIKCYKDIINEQLRDNLLFLSDYIENYDNIDFFEISPSDFKVNTSKDVFGTYHDSEFINAFVECSSIYQMYEMFDNSHNFFKVFNRYALTCYAKNNLTYTIQHYTIREKILKELRKETLEELCNLIKGSINDCLKCDKISEYFIDEYIHNCMYSGKKYLLENKTYKLIELNIRHLD